MTRAVRKALILATEYSLAGGQPKQNKAQFLSLVEAALVQLEEQLGPDQEYGNVNSIMKRFTRS